MALLVENISDLDSSKQIILVCKTGRRAEALANLLETEYGFTDVAIMGGGVTAWAAKFDPTNEMY
jgi:adenylyltransferase/sulfurtransferase